jgi:hypothetical protein
MCPLPTRERRGRSLQRDKRLRALRPRRVSWAPLVPQPACSACGGRTCNRPLDASKHSPTPAGGGRERGQGYQTPNAGRPTTKHQTQGYHTPNGKHQTPNTGLTSTKHQNTLGASPQEGLLSTSSEESWHLSSCLIINQSVATDWSRSSRSLYMYKWIDQWMDRKIDRSIER